MLMGEGLLIVFGVHIIYDIGLLWVGLIQPGLCGVNHLIPE